MNKMKRLIKLLNEFKDQELSSKTKEWLDKWVGDKTGMKVYPSKDIIEELSQFKPKKNVFLYRFIERKDIKNESKKRLKSYTYLKKMVDFWAEENAGKGGYVEYRTIKSKQILVDFTKLPKKYKDEYLNEIIIMEK